MNDKIPNSKNSKKSILFIKLFLETFVASLTIVKIINRVQIDSFFSL